VRLQRAAGFPTDEREGSRGDVSRGRSVRRRRAARVLAVGRRVAARDCAWLRARRPSAYSPGRRALSHFELEPLRKAADAEDHLPDGADCPGDAESWQPDVLATAGCASTAQARPRPSSWSSAGVREVRRKVGSRTMRTCAYGREFATASRGLPEHRRVPVPSGDRFRRIRGMQASAPRSSAYISLFSRAPLVGGRSRCLRGKQFGRGVGRALQG